MHVKALAVGVTLSVACALAQDLNDPVQSSIFSVLRTAIPEDVQLSAFNNPSSFGAEVASSISAGNAPDWYTALPADVKSALPSLYPAAVVTTPSATPTPTAVSSESESESESVAIQSSSQSPSETSSSVATTTSETPSETPSGTAEESEAPESTGAANAPTAAFGAGVVGLMGMVGMLVL